MWFGHPPVHTRIKKTTKEQSDDSYDSASCYLLLVEERAETKLSEVKQSHQDKE